jgi:hypothetical protein
MSVIRIWHIAVIKEIEEVTVRVIGGNMSAIHREGKWNLRMAVIRTLRETHLPSSERF